MRVKYLVFTHNAMTKKRGDMMKNVIRLFIFTMLVAAIISISISCEIEHDNKTEEGPPKYPSGLGWPSELVPKLSYVPELPWSMWQGGYRNTNSRVLGLFRIVDNKGDKSTLKIVVTGQNAEFDLIEVNGREMKVQCTLIFQGTQFIQDEIYTLCTDYTLTGSGVGAVLTFTGGDLPIASEETWTYY